MAQIASVTQEVVAANQVPEDRHLPRPLQLHQTRVTPQVEVVAAAAGATEIMVSLLTMRWEVLPVPAETMEKLLMTLSATAVVAVVAGGTLKAVSCIRDTAQFRRSQVIRSQS